MLTRPVPRPDQPLVPEARGKAAAFDTTLAPGGGTTDLRNPGIQQRGRNAGLPFGYKRTKGGQVTFKGRVVHHDIGNPGARFTEGPLKGKTYDQAKQEFEKKWETAPGDVKDKYAARGNGSNDLAPSETQEASDKDGNGVPDMIQRAPVPRPSAQQSRMQNYKDQTRTRIKQTSGEAGLAAYDQSQKPAAPAPSPTFADLTKTPPTPGGGVQSVGDGSSAATGWKPDPATLEAGKASRQTQANALLDEARGKMAPNPTIQPASNPALSSVAGSGQSFNGPVPRPQPALSRMPTKPDLSGPGVGSMAGIGNSFQNAAVANENASGQAAWTPVGAGSATSPAEAPITSPADARRADEQRLSTPKPAGNPMVDRVVSGAPVPPPTPAFPVVSAAQAQTPVSQPTGSAITGVPELLKRPPVARPSPINKTTGLPMGYHPGDQVDAAQQPLADASMARQQTATNAAAPTPPVARPAPAADRYADAQNQYQAGKAPATAMDGIYNGANSRDQATITANSLRRAGKLLPVPRPVLAR